MASRMVFAVLVLGGGLAALAQQAVHAQPEAAPSGSSPLGVRQQRVERMMADLQQKFIGLKLALVQTEPDHAERLQAALNRAKELLLQKRMAETVQLLNQAQLDAALVGQEAILADLRTLAQLLSGEGDVRQRAREEFERLGQWKSEIEKFLGAEQELRNRAADARQDAADLAARQQELARETDRLAHLMQQARSGRPSASPSGEQGVAQAATAMQQAAAELRRQQSAQAQHSQEQAIDNLQQALAEIEQRLAEQRGAAQAAILAALEANFREMLKVQQDLSRQTAELEQQRLSGGGQLSRLQRNLVRTIGERERRLEVKPTEAGEREPGLAGLAQQSLEMIRGEGTAVVLADVVEQLRDDLVAVGGLLADQLHTGPQAAAMQHDIELVLRSLLDALERTSSQRASEPSAAPPAAGDAASGQQPLVPTSAELKLLRTAQLQVNRQTAALDDARQQGSLAGDDLKQQTARVADRQAKVAEMAARLLESTP